MYKRQDTYTLTVGTKVKGDLQKAMAKLSKSTKGAVKHTDQLDKEVRSLKAKPLNQLACYVTLAPKVEPST